MRASRGRSISSAARARVWDVDGRELWDFHNGFGSMVMGRAIPQSSGRSPSAHA
jgi:glutamate-1-semialdehyde aminotransferase